MPEMRTIGLLFVLVGVLLMLAMEFWAASDEVSVVFTLLGGAAALVGGVVAYQRSDDQGAAAKSETMD